MGTAESTSSGHKAFVPPCRKLVKAELAGVILGCTHSTEPECLRKGLFGLPACHYRYVRLITPGLPLFLFNYESRTLSGVFRATSNGGLKIDGSAWSPDYSPTRFPAQVRVELWEQCPVLNEEVFRPILEANYYSRQKFFFELDNTQRQDLLAEFGITGCPSPVQAPQLSSQPLLPAVPYPPVIISTHCAWSAGYSYPAAPYGALPTFSPVQVYSFSAQATPVTVSSVGPTLATGTALDASCFPVYNAASRPQSLRKRRRVSKPATGAPYACAGWQPLPCSQRCEESGFPAWEDVSGGEQPLSIAAVLEGFYNRLQARASQFYGQPYRDKILGKLRGAGGGPVQGEEAVLRELVQEEVGKAHLTCRALVSEVKAAALSEGLAALEERSGEHLAAVQECKRVLNEGLARFEASGLAYVERAKEKGRTVIFTSNAHYLRDSLGKARTRLRQRFGGPPTEELERVEALQIKVGAYWKVLLKRLADEIPIELKFTLQQELKLSPDLLGYSDLGFGVEEQVGSRQPAGRRKRKR